MYHLANGASDDTTSSHLLQGEIIDERERMKEGVACNLNFFARTYVLGLYKVLRYLEEIVAFVSDF